MCFRISEDDEQGSRIRLAAVEYGDQTYYIIDFTKVGQTLEITKNKQEKRFSEMFTGSSDSD